MLPPLQAEMFIRDEFARTGARFQERRKDFCLNCFNSHVDNETGQIKSDRKYKLWVSKDGTKAHCWVCNWSGSWNKLASHYGFRKMGDSEDSGFSREMAEADVFSDLTRRIKENIDVPQVKINRTLPEDISELPRGLFWRGISSDFLASIPCYLWAQKSFSERKNKHYYTQRLLFPFYQDGNLLGWSGRRLDTSDFMRYYNADWSEMTKILYPSDFVFGYFNSTSVVLVEGQVDALKLVYGGVPALSIMGSSGWSPYKRNYLLAKGIKRLFLCMDGDVAGRMAAEHIYHDSHLYFDDIFDIVLEPGTDPGEWDQTKIDWLRTAIIG